MATDCLTQLLGGNNNCTGTCIYGWNGSQYVLLRDNCSGGSGCPGCQPLNVTDSIVLRGLVFILGPSCFPDPDNIVVSCGVNTQDLPDQLRPILKRHPSFGFLTEVDEELIVVS